MRILKNPDNLIFDTENSQKIEINSETIKTFIPLHHSTNKTDWDFLSEHFKSNEEIKHPIFNNFGDSYFYFLSV